MKATSFPLLATLLLSLLGLSACNESVEEFCGPDPSQPSKMEEPFISAELALQPWVEPLMPDGRVLASPRKTLLAPLDRKSWGEWAKERLKLAQSYYDLTETRTELLSVKEELKTLSFHLVTFHGYAERGDAERMVWTLGRIREESAKVRFKLCQK